MRVVTAVPVLKAGGWPVAMARAKRPQAKATCIEIIDLKVRAQYVVVVHYLPVVVVT